MFEKHPWKSDILRKDAGHRPASLLKMSLFHKCFVKHFDSKNQLPGFYIGGTLVENGLIQFFLLVNLTSSMLINCLEVIS